MAKEMAVDDVRLVAQRADTAVRSGQLDRELAALAIARHGDDLAAAGDPDGARREWTRAIALAPTSRGGRESAARLR